MKDKSYVKIAVVDDHRLFLNGLSLVIEDMEQNFDVAVYEAPLELIEAIENGESFDVVLCDLVMNAMNGLAFVAALRAHSSIPVLMLSGINTAPPVEEMKRLGAQGFIHKSINIDSLLVALQTILNGGEYFPDIPSENHAPSSASYSDTERIELLDSDTIPTLTPRQVEVLQLISGGASNSQISEKLSISENTVKSHIKQLFDLLQVNKRTACVRAAQLYGLI